MTIGERIRMSRVRAGLSQRALAAQAKISPMAISKYEQDRMTPSSTVLIRLSRALDVTLDYLLRSTTVTLSAPDFRCNPSLTQKQRERIVENVRDWIERYRVIEDLYEDSPSFTMLPEADRIAETLVDVEAIAERLRHHWDLGLAPIENLVEVLELHGIKVGLIDAPENFSALVLTLDDRNPVIVTRKNMPGDRQRFSLAHELGHLTVIPGEGLDPEKAAYRFAGAFLAPRPMVLYELGRRRDAITPYELHLLKHKYGLSMQAWIHRAREAEILTENAAKKLFDQFKKQGWRKREPGDQLGSEEPIRMKRLVYRAWSEGIISESRAGELLGEALQTFCEEEERRHGDIPIALCH